MITRLVVDSVGQTRELVTLSVLDNSAVVPGDGLAVLELSGVEAAVACGVTYFDVDSRFSTTLFA